MKKNSPLTHTPRMVDGAANGRIVTGRVLALTVQSILTSVKVSPLHVAVVACVDVSAIAGTAITIIANARKAITSFFIVLSSLLRYSSIARRIKAETLVRSFSERISSFGIWSSPRYIFVRLYFIHLIYTTKLSLSTINMEVP